MPDIIFTKGAYSFTFSKGRSFPLHDPEQVNVPVDYSAGVQIYPHDQGIEEQFFNLTFAGLSQTDYDNFDNWLTDVAVGPKNTFTYTDEDSVEHTVRLLNTRNPIKQLSSGLFSGTIMLRKEI